MTPPNTPADNMQDENIVDKLHRFGVYLEHSYNKKLWCYKYQFPGQDVIIVCDSDETKGGHTFFVEYLKSLHYSIRYLYESEMFCDLKVLIDKMKAFGDPNIDKVIEILEGAGVNLKKLKP